MVLKAIGPSLSYRFGYYEIKESQRFIRRLLSVAMPRAELLDKVCTYQRKQTWSKQRVLNEEQR